MFSILLLGLEFLYVSVVIIILYRLKPKFGLTLLFIFIGSNQYFQTILTTFNIHIGFLSFSPGSVIIFSSSIFAVLLVYLKDGVKSARTLIYGIVIANFSIKILSMVTYGQFENMSFHIQNFGISPELFRVNFRTYYVGIAALIIDSYLLIIFYDFLKYKVKYKSLFGRIFFSLLVALVLDSVLFTTGSFFELPNYSNILLSQLFSKSIAATMFSAILYIYFQFFDKEWTTQDSATINTKFDVFSILTYREKYKELKIESEQKLKQQLAEITSLNTIFKNISSNIAIDKLVSAIIKELNVNLQPDLILFYKRNNSDLDILGINVNDSLRKYDQSNQHKVGTCLCGLAVKTKTPQYSVNINVDSRCTLNECKNAGFKSFAALPLLNKNEVIGVIGIASSAERDFKLKSYFLETIAAEAAIALSNSMLYSELQNQKKELQFEVIEKNAVLDSLMESEKRYFNLFDNSPIAIWEEDFSECIQYLNEKSKTTKKNIEAFLDDDREVKKCSSLVKIIDVNKTTLAMYNVKSKQQFFNSLSNIFLPESYKIFKNALIALYNGNNIFEGETTYKKATGELMYMFTKWNITHSSENNVSTVIVSLLDITTIKKHEDKSNKLHRQLTQTLEKMSDGFVSLDNNWNYTYVNNQAALMYGKKSEELIGKDIRFIFNKKENEVFYENYIKAFETQTQISFSEYWQPSNQLYENKVIPSKNGIAIFIKNITFIKEAEIQLKESESKYRTIVDNSHSGIGIIDNNFTILYANERLADIFGSSQEEIVGENIGDFLTEESKSLVLSRYKKRQSGEILPTSYEYTIKRKDGSIREIKGSASVIQTSSGKKNTIAQLLDITEEKLANNKLIASENKFRSVVEHAPDAMYLFDFEGNIIDFNKKAMEKLGYTSEELHNLKMNDISQDFFEKNETADIIKKMKPNKPIWIERNHIKKDGTIFPVEISAGLVEIDERTLILGFARDVTEKEKDKEKLRKYRYKLEELVKQRTIQLEEAYKELESFSYSVSHDLRAPLRHINGFIELLSIDSSAKLGSKSMHYLETISHASDQMGNLIDELLDFSRMGRSSMSFTEIDFGDLIHDVKNELLRDNIVAKRNIEWEITKMPMTYGDITMLRTVIVNLLSNAIKYTSKKEKSFIKINCNCENTKDFIFCVADNGAGFDSRFADKLFGVFQRLHSKQEFEGTGIGLANVRRIISRHRGKTWAESEVDKGAKFYFSLPKKNNITSK